MILSARTAPHPVSTFGVMPTRTEPVTQLSIDALGTPLVDVTFCVLDFETTGGSAADGAITEIGAVRYRGGERLGTLQTLVDPGRAIPPEITVLTGITQSMVARAPRISAVLGTLVDFIGDAVVVGHNVRYDMGYLQAALEANGYERLGNPTVDTLALARRLFDGEVPNHRLGTLADRLRLPNRPSHRALDDALATADLLHALIERASAFGVLGLDDLAELPGLAGHPQRAKLKLTADLPRAPGVYAFVDAQGRILYVGKATDLRSRVRSYFSGDTRRKVGAMLRETTEILHTECPAPLEAEVLEIRLIRDHRPRYNRRGAAWNRYAYLQLTLGERFPRLVAARKVKPDKGLYLGPFSGTGVVRRMIEAIWSVSKVRRCRKNPTGRNRPLAPCAAAQLGVSSCPCSGSIAEQDYRLEVDRLREGLTRQPEFLLEPLAERIGRLAAQERFEEAAEARDQADTLAAGLERQRLLDRVRAMDEMVLETGTGSGLRLRHGEMVESWSPGQGCMDFALGLERPAPLGVDPDGPVAAELVDELMVVGRWLDTNAARVRMTSCDGAWADPVPAVRRFRPARADKARPHR